MWQGTITGTCRCGCCAISTARSTASTSSRVPLLVIHGDRDGVIPIALGERLFAAAPEPKRFVTLPGVDHVSVLEQGGLGPVRAFLDAVERTAS